MSLLLILIFIIVKLFTITKLLKPIKTNYLDIVENENKFLNCIEKEVYCTEDIDCVGLCNFQFKCNKKTFTCAPTSHITNSPFNGDIIDCDQHRGAFNALSTNILGELEYSCIETFPNLFESSGKLRPYVCSGNESNFSVNLDNKIPEVKDCLCTNDKFLVVKEGDSNTPRCAKYTEFNLFKNLKRVDVDDVYD